MDNKLLENYFKKCKVFIDTCSLLKGKPIIEPFFKEAIPLIKKYSNPIIIPSKVYEELRKHSSSRNETLSQNAKYCINLIEKLSEEKIIEIRGEPSDKFADNVFLVVFTKFRLTHNLMLITQDINLSIDLLNLNNSKSVQSRNFISVTYFDKQGILKISNKTTKKSIARNNNSNEKFALCKEVTTLDEKPLQISYIPKENEEVYISNGTIMLLNKIASGGEGTIYKTNTPYVAKIYKKELITKRKIQKIGLMVSKHLEYDGICFPIDSIYNRNKEFVGYLMKNAEGKEIQKSLFIKPLLQKNFPHWKKIDTVKLAITILKKIQFLHERNIIMGDINPANILVMSPDKVFFVDTDSYQIEDFPCPVGTVNFTAPEIQRKHFGGFLRTFGNENFAIATLLFMLMLPGKPPYSQQGGEDPMSNIINMDFSYRFNDDFNGKAPDGPWRFIWSHLPYKVKECFYNSFSKNGKNSVESKRLGVKDWIFVFNNYLYLLDSGKLTEQDPMSGDIFPNRFKRVKNEENVYETRQCVDCNNEFSISQSEYEFFTNKGLNLPKRCPNCRNKHKSHKQNIAKPSKGGNSHDIFKFLDI